jgi:glycerol uptake operon antiterminator
MSALPLERDVSYFPPDPETFIARVAANPCCAAITAEENIGAALVSRSPVVFILRGNGLALAPVVRRVHDAGKLVAVHVDLVGGLRADRSSIGWLANAGVDAVISSHGQLMPAVRHEGMTSILRLLLVRRSQLDTAVAAIGRAAPDIIEILPGVILPSVVGLLPPFRMPVLAGGFVRTEAEVAAALSAGALGITTSSQALWGFGDN